MMTALTPKLGRNERDFVFAVAMKIVKNEIEADDVAQEALLLAHRHRESFAGNSKYSTWLYRVAVTTALMHLRSKKRKGREVSTSQLPEGEHSWLDTLECREASPERRCAAREELVRVDSTLTRLGPKYESLLHLRWYEGCSEKEISKRLRLPLTTVKNRSFRARRQVLLECRQAA